MQLLFSGKAGTLKTLQGRLKSACIAPLVTFSFARWRDQPEACLEDVKVKLGNGPWIVRSSCLREDQLEESRAGAFLSLLDIDDSMLADAISKVFASYGEELLEQEVLVQPMLRQVIRSGVVFSHDPHTCTPYRIINWAEGRNTTVVTGGLGGRVWQQAAGCTQPPPGSLVPVIKLIEELQSLFGEQPLDCEFAVTEEAGGEILWLLQVRPLVIRQNIESKLDQTKRLQQIAEKVAVGMRPSPFLLGQRTVYGVMPDWNPAEIIGLRPKPLALSLYRELVTDSIWAYQRHNYGYRNLRSFPLMPNFSGLPYIDVRVSFNSFIPADLDEGLAGRLVDYYISRLIEAPELHDKVEFEVVLSCYSLDLPGRLKSLANAGFSQAECEVIAQSLRNLTNRIIHPENGLWKADAAKLEVLQARRERLDASDVTLIERIYWLIEDAKRYGTLPFAGLARAGFVAIQILKSLVSIGIFSQADYDAFVASVSTVSRQLAYDRVTLGRVEFLNRYGHLRPGTYDILSPRYDEEPEQYFDWNDALALPEPAAPFSLTLTQMREIGRLLKEHHLNPDPVGLFDFLQAGIELRELAKFHFTRNLSDALALINKLGVNFGFDRESLSYCEIGVIKDLYISSEDPRESLGRSIELGRRRYEEALKTSLPPLITSPEDVWSFSYPENQPNYITQKVAIADPTTVLDYNNLAGRIVCIPNADPGYDWLFAHPIAGLITMWGGANSHMAIRASEQGLPAVIGAGEVLYQRWSAAKKLRIDCANRQVELIS